MNVTEQQAHQYKLGLDLIVFGAMVTSIIELSPQRDQLLERFSSTIAQIVEGMKRSAAPERRQMGNDLDILAATTFGTLAAETAH
jgi:hypothetical protein